MDFNERYKKDFETIKNAINPSGKVGSEAIIAGKLGKNGTFFTDRRRNSKPFTKEDLILLHYNFGEFLENPIVKNIEVIGNEDNKPGANSGSPDQDPNTFLELISKKQRELAAEIDAFLKASSGRPSKSGNQLKGVKDRRQRLHDIGKKTDKIGKGTESEP